MKVSRISEDESDSFVRWPYIVHGIAFFVVVVLSSSTVVCEVTNSFGPDK